MAHYLGTHVGRSWAGLIYIGTAPRARKAQRGHGAPCRGYHSRMTTPTVKIFSPAPWAWSDPSPMVITGST